MYAVMRSATATPPSTASDPPSQKSFWTSTTTSASAIAKGNGGGFRKSLRATSTNSQGQTRCKAGTQSHGALWASRVAWVPMEEKTSPPDVRRAVRAHASEGGEEVISNMLKAIRKRMDREEGFTLIELMVVVLIIAILIAIAIPTFLGARKRANDRAAQSNLRNALTAEKTYFTDNQKYSNVSADLSSVEGSLKWQVSGVVPTTANP